MTNLATRITERIAQDRAMLAAGTQGKWEYAYIPSCQIQHCVQQIKSNGGRYTVASPVHSNEETAANMRLIAACVNGKERELLAIEGLLEIVTGCLVCEGTGIAKQKGTSESGHREWSAMLCLRCAKPLHILARWLEGRERDEKA